MSGMRPYVIGAVLGVLGLAVVPVAGLLPHRSDEDSVGAAWYLWIANRQSVTLRSLLTVPPADLDDPDRAARGAGHYELVCAACHGSPTSPPDRIAQDMTPQPPPLAEGARWRPDARMFQTIRDGLRHSAMPAWPARGREDEVWDMVAFLRVLPDMEAGAYRDMAGEAGSCRHCHGETGEGRFGMPRLDILSPEYIASALEAYRDGTRRSGTMIAVARGMEDAAIRTAAERFGTTTRPTLPPDDGSDAAGLALRGDAARDIPACLSCHLTGDPKVIPGLLGQEAEYLRRQLLLFTAEHPDRGGPRQEMMVKAAKGLREAEIAALAEWLSLQRPE